MEAVELLIPLVAGIGLGLLYLGGLWWTVRAAVRTRFPGGLLVVSWLTRLVILLGGLLLVAGGDWRRLLVAVAGFTIARLAVVRGVARIGSRREATP